MDKQRPASDEIDISQLFRKIGDTLRTGWLNLIRLLALIRRIPIENKFSFVAIMVISVGFAFLYSILLKSEYYESTMILSSDYLNKRLVENTVKKLDLLAKEQNKSGLARLFNISDTLAMNIAGFQAKPFISEEELIDLELLKEKLRNAQGDEIVVDQVIERIEIENRHSFEIIIRTYNPTVIPNLQDALVHYLRDNEYVKRRIEINKINLEARMKKLERELQKMDSLKLVIYDNYKTMAEQGRAGSNNVILSDRAVTNPIEIYAQDLELYTELQNVKRDLYLQPDFEIIDGFTEFSEPASLSTPKMVVYALLIGLLVAYLDVAIRRLNSYLSTIE